MEEPKCEKHIKSHAPITCVICLYDENKRLREALEKIAWQMAGSSKAKKVAQQALGRKRVMSEYEQYITDLRNEAQKRALTETEQSILKSYNQAIEAAEAYKQGFNDAKTIILETIREKCLGT